MSDDLRAALVEAVKNTIVGTYALFRDPKYGTELVDSEYRELAEVATSAVLEFLATDERAVDVVQQAVYGKPWDCTVRSESFAIAEEVLAALGDLKERVT